MGSVLDYFRTQVDPKFANVPDGELIDFIGDTHKEFLSDPEFSQQYAARREEGKQFTERSSQFWSQLPEVTPNRQDVFKSQLAEQAAKPEAPVLAAAVIPQSVQAITAPADVAGSLIEGAGQGYAFGRQALRGDLSQAAPAYAKLLGPVSAASQLESAVGHFTGHPTDIVGTVANRLLPPKKTPMQYRREVVGDPRLGIEPNPVYGFGNYVRRAAAGTQQRFDPEGLAESTLLGQVIRQGAELAPALLEAKIAAGIFAIRGAGEAYDRVFEEAIAGGKSPNEAAALADKASVETAGKEFAVWGPGAKALSELTSAKRAAFQTKLGGTPRAGQLGNIAFGAGELGALGGASQAGQNVIEGKPVMEGVPAAVGTSAAVGGFFGAKSAAINPEARQRNLERQVASAMEQVPAGRRIAPPPGFWKQQPIAEEFPVAQQAEPPLPPPEPATPRLTPLVVPPEVRPLGPRKRIRVETKAKQNVAPPMETSLTVPDLALYKEGMPAIQQSVELEQTPTAPVPPAEVERVKKSEEATPEQKARAESDRINNLYQSEHSAILDLKRQLEYVEKYEPASAPAIKTELDDTIQRLGEFDKLFKRDDLISVLDSPEIATAKAIRQNPKLTYDEAVLEAQRQRRRDVENLIYDEEPVPEFAKREFPDLFKTTTTPPAPIPRAEVIPEPKPQEITPTTELTPQAPESGWRPEIKGWSARVNSFLDGERKIKDVLELARNGPENAVWHTRNMARIAEIEGAAGYDPKRADRLRKLADKIESELMNVAPKPPEIAPAEPIKPEPAQSEVKIDKIRLLRDEGLTEQQAADLISGKRGIEDVVDESLKPLMDEMMDSPGNVMGAHLDAVELARKDALKHITDILAGRDPYPPLKPAAKQPWEVTKDEYHDFLLETDPVFAKAQWQNRKQANRTDDSLGNVGRNRRGGADKEHRALVEQALLEGKSVPQEVLADYPDLKPATEGKVNKNAEETQRKEGLLVQPEITPGPPEGSKPQVAVKPAPAPAPVSPTALEGKGLVKGDGNKLWEFSREQAMMDRPLEYDTETGWQVGLRYLDNPAGPTKGTHTLWQSEKPERGGSTFGPFGRAIITTIKKAEPRRVLKGSEFEQRNRFGEEHKAAVEKAILEGKIASHPDYPDLNPVTPPPSVSPSQPSENLGSVVSPAPAPAPTGAKTAEAGKVALKIIEEDGEFNATAIIPKDVMPNRLGLHVARLSQRTESGDYIIRGGWNRTKGEAEQKLIDSLSASKAELSGASYESHQKDLANHEAVAEPIRAALGEQIKQRRVALLNQAITDRQASGHPAIWIDDQVITESGKYRVNDNGTLAKMQDLSSKGFEKNLLEVAESEGEGRWWGANKAAKDRAGVLIAERDAKAAKEAAAQEEQRKIRTAELAEIDAYNSSWNAIELPKGKKQVVKIPVQNAQTGKPEGFKDQEMTVYGNLGILKNTSGSEKSGYKYFITHVPTGLSLGNELKISTLKQAQDFVKALIHTGVDLGKKNFSNEELKALSQAKKAMWEGANVPDFWKAREREQPATSPPAEVPGKSEAAQARASPPASPAQVLSTSKLVKVVMPKGATMVQAVVRYKGADRPQAPISKEALEKSNVYNGTEVVKVQAGIINRVGKFEPVGEPTITPREPANPHASEKSKETSARAAKLGVQEVVVQTEQEALDAMNQQRSATGAKPLKSAGLENGVAAYYDNGTIYYVLDGIRSPEHFAQVQREEIAHHINSSPAARTVLAELAKAPEFATERREIQRLYPKVEGETPEKYDLRIANELLAKSRIQEPGLFRRVVEWLIERLSKLPVIGDWIKKSAENRQAILRTISQRLEAGFTVGSETDVPLMSKGEPADKEGLRRSQHLGVPNAGQWGVTEAIEPIRQDVRAKILDSTKPYSPELLLQAWKIENQLTDYLTRSGRALEYHNLLGNKDAGLATLKQEVIAVAMKAAANGDESLLRHSFDYSADFQTITGGSATAVGRALHGEQGEGYDAVNDWLGKIYGTERENLAQIKSGLDHDSFFKLIDALKNPEVDVAAIETEVGKGKNPEGKTVQDIVDEVPETERPKNKEKVESSEQIAQRILDVYAKSQSDTLSWPQQTWDTVREVFKGLLNGDVTHDEFRATLDSMKVKGSTTESLIGVAMRELEILKQIAVGRQRQRRAELWQAEMDRMAQQAQRSAEGVLKGLELRNSGVEWLQPGKRRDRVRDIITAAFKPSEPILENPLPWIDALRDELVSAGVDFSTAARLAQEVHQARETKWVSANLRSLERAAGSSRLGSLIESILSSPYRAQYSEGWMHDTAIRWFESNGLSKSRAETAYELFEPQFKKALADAQEKIVRKVLAGKNPKTLDDLTVLIRSGVLKPNKNWVDELAQQKGWVKPSHYAFQNLDRLDYQLGDPALSPEEKKAIIESQHAIIRHLGKRDKQAMLAVAESFTSSLLTGPRTFFVQFGPWIMAARDLAIQSAFDPGNTMNFMRSMFYAAKNNILVQAKYTWQKDFSAFHLNELENNFKELQRLHEDIMQTFKTGTRTQQVVAGSKWLYAQMRFVGRTLNTMDSVSASFVREYKLAYYSSLALKEAGLNSRMIGELLDFQQSARQAEYDRWIDAGMSDDVAQLRANATIDKTTRDFMSNRIDPAVVEEIFRSAELDYLSSIGRRAEGVSEVGENSEGLLSKPMNAVVKFVGEQKARGGWSAIGAQTLFGFISIPWRSTRFASTFSWYGLVRAGIDAYRKSHNLPSYWAQSYANVIQSRARLREAIAGTLVGIAAGALMGLHSTSDDDIDKKKKGVYITGYGPTNKVLRDAWDKLGFKQYSLMIVNPFTGKLIAIPLTRVGEFIMYPFVIAAAMDDAQWKAKERRMTGTPPKNPISQFAATMIGEHLSMMGQRGLLQTAGQLYQLSQSSGSLEKGAARLLASTASGIIMPFKQLAASISEMFIGPLDNTSASSLVANAFPLVGYPWQNKALNRFGDQMYDRSWYGRLQRLGIPVAFQVADSPANRQLYTTLIDKGVSPPAIQRSALETRFGPMSDEAFAKYVTISGKNLKAATLSNLPRLSAMTQPEAESWLSKASTSANLQAETVMGLSRIKPLAATSGGGGSDSGGAGMAGPLVSRTSMGRSLVGRGTRLAGSGATLMRRTGRSGFRRTTIRGLGRRTGLRSLGIRRLGTRRLGVRKLGTRRLRLRLA